MKDDGEELWCTLVSKTQTTHDVCVFVFQTSFPDLRLGVLPGRHICFT